MKVLYVETNFLIEHARAETTDADLLLRMAEQRGLKLVVPVFCIYEASQKQRRDTPEQEQWASRFSELARSLERKRLNADHRDAFRLAAEGLRRLNDVWRSGLDETIDRVSKSAELISLTPTLVQSARQFALELAKGDPWHVAAILEHYRSRPAPDEEALFLSRDAEVRALINGKGVPVAAASAAVVAKWGLQGAPPPAA